MKKLLISSFFILLFWAFFVPTFEFPDEQQHFATVALLTDTGRMPKGEKEDLSVEIEKTEKILQVFRDRQGNNFYTYHPENKITYSTGIYGTNEQIIMDSNNQIDRLTYQKREAAQYPFLYYAFSSVFYFLVAQFSIFTRLFFVRIGSVILGVANIYVAYKIGKEIFRKESNAMAIAILTLLQPMMSFTMSGVNSDVLHNLLFSLIILYSLKLISRENIFSTSSFLLLFLGLDLITKPQAYIAIPIIFTALLFRVINTGEIKQTIKGLGFLSVVGMIVGFIVQKEILINFFQTGRIPYATRSIHPQAPGLFEYARYSIHRLISQNIVWYWGVFKWLGVVLPSIFWRIANRLVVLSLLGVVVSFFKKYSLEKKLKTSLLILISIGYIVAIFWFDWQRVTAVNRQIAVQARYYFPTLVAHMALLYVGLIAFSGKSWVKLATRQAIITFFIILQVVGIYTIAKSYYDVSSVQNLFIQASQYKPYFVKGYFWIIWLGAYIVSMVSIFKIGISSDE